MNKITLYTYQRIIGIIGISVFILLNSSLDNVFKHYQQEIYKTLNKFKSIVNQICVISSDPLFIKGNARFSTVAL